VLLAPWLAFLAAITSLVLLAFKTAGGETPVPWLSVLWLWFLAAAYSQFFGGSDLARAAGLAAQTLLAVILLVWRKLDA
jgi:hypothetical protein